MKSNLAPPMSPKIIRTEERLVPFVQHLLIPQKVQLHVGKNLACIKLQSFTLEAFPSHLRQHSHHRFLGVHFHGIFAISQPWLEMKRALLQRIIKEFRFHQ
jgi:hypothetical protein